MARLESNSYSTGPGSTFRIRSSLRCAGTDASRVCRDIQDQNLVAMRQRGVTSSRPHVLLMSVDDSCRLQACQTSKPGFNPGVQNACLGGRSPVKHRGFVDEQLLQQKKAWPSDLPVQASRDSSAPRLSRQSQRSGPSCHLQQQQSLRRCFSSCHRDRRICTSSLHNGIAFRTRR